VSSPLTPPSRPLPVASTSSEDRRLVPAGWLDGAPVTRALLALNIAVFGVEVAMTHQMSHLPSRAALALGASYPPATVSEHRWETLLTACFLHDGLVHVGVNMLVL